MEYHSSCSFIVMNSNQANGCNWVNHQQGTTGLDPAVPSLKNINKYIYIYYNYSIFMYIYIYPFFVLVGGLNPSEKY